MKRILTLLLISFIGTFIFTACVEKFDVADALKDISDDTNLGGDTLYILLSPVWEGFNNPQDILIGNEPFIYVADTDNDRIVMLNLAGEVLGERMVKKPYALAQDYQMNLIVCAEYDTTIAGVTQTFGAIYKFDLIEGSHRIDIAPMKRLMPRKAVSIDFTRPLRRYTGVSVFYDNTFYVSRKGPSNTSLVDPDNSVLIFQKRTLQNGSRVDTLIGRLPNMEPLGTGLNSANEVSSLTSFKRNNADFIMTMTGNTSFKVQWREFVVTQEFSGYVNKLTPAVSDLMRVNKFEQPEGCAIDNSGNIYVVDAAKDSVYRFNAFGDQLQAFGGGDVFNNPKGIAYFDRTLYIADTGNNRIVRFILSTEIR